MASWGRRTAAMLAFGLAVAAGCNGTSGGGTGDPHTHPTPDQYGMDTDGMRRIHDVVAPATWFNDANGTSMNCAFPPTVTHQFTGQVVVAVDNYDETGGGETGTVYIEDVPENGGDPAPYSGMEVFNPSYTPPDLRLAVGDVTDSFGQLEEFNGPSTYIFAGCRTLPEFLANLSARSENGPTAPFTLVKAGTSPTDFKPFDVIRGYANARQWLGMLVRFENVTIGAAPACSNTIDQAHCNASCSPCDVGRWQADINIGGGVEASDTWSIDNELFDVGHKGPPIAANTHFTAVTGIVTYFGSFHIAPRSIDDFEL